MYCIIALGDVGTGQYGLESMVVDRLAPAFAPLDIDGTKWAGSPNRSPILQTVQCHQVGIL